MGQLTPLLDFFLYPPGQVPLRETCKASSSPPSASILLSLRQELLRTSNSSFGATLPPNLVVPNRGFSPSVPILPSVDGGWGWGGKDNLEAGFRFIILPPREAGYFQPGGVVSESFQVFVFSSLVCALSIPLTPNFAPPHLSLPLAMFPFLILFCPSLLAPPSLSLLPLSPRAR